MFNMVDGAKMPTRVSTASHFCYPVVHKATSYKENVKTNTGNYTHVTVWVANTLKELNIIRENKQFKEAISTT